MDDATLQTCQQCATTDPMNDKLGWLTMAYQNGRVMGVFCGGGCAQQWLTAAMDRLTQAVLGKQGAREG